MQYYVCDGCGKRMSRHALRYTVRIDVRAAYDTLEVGLADLMRDHRGEIARLIDQMKRREIDAVEEQVYKCIQLDLCRDCQKAYIRAPLRLHPEQGEDAPDPVDIDAFLRSLGFGEGEARD